MQSIDREVGDVSNASEQPSLKDGDRLIATYQAGFVPSPDPAQPYMGRSGFVHPMVTPAGNIVTDGMPLDHIHQHALMFAWTSSRIEGVPVDFWNSGKRLGRIEHVETIEATPDRIVVELKHVNQTTTPESTAIRETWQLDRVPHPTMNVIDLTSTQLCMLDHPITIAEYHYGGMCIRGSSEWAADKVTMRTNETSDRIAADHTRPRWAAMTGTVRGNACGIAAISHRENFRSPQPVRIHASMPYFCFAPMVLGEFKLEPGVPYVSRFRFVAFDGELDEPALEPLCQW